MVFLLFPEWSTVLPQPLEVIKVGVNEFSSGNIFIDILVSLKRVTVGFLLATIIAIPLAIFSAHHKIGRYLVNINELLRHIPPIAWIPVAIVFFGLGDASAFFIVFLGSFFPIFLNTFFGANSLPLVYIRVCQSFELPKMVYMKDILFKFSLPYIFTGLRIGIGMAWMSVIAAELVGAQSGLGYYIQFNRLLLHMDKVVFGMLLIGLIGLSLNKLIKLLEKKVLVWVPSNHHDRN